MAELEFLRDLLTKIGEDVSRLNHQVDHLGALHIQELEERAEIKATVKSLQSKVDTLCGLLGEHKKKGFFAILIAVLVGGAVASGSLNYTGIIKSFFGK
jgi:hypothetical protein